MAYKNVEETEPRFAGLKFISLALKILAIIVSAVALITALASIFTTLPPITRFATFVAILVGGAVQALLLWAGGELITLLIYVEHNTFETKEALKKPQMPPTKKSA